MTDDNVIMILRATLKRLLFKMPKKIQCPRYRVDDYDDEGPCFGRCSGCFDSKRGIWHRHKDTEVTRWTDHLTLCPVCHGEEEVNNPEYVWLEGVLKRTERN
jgi:hypothetical protein